jgi:hypothetical protein
MSRRPRIGRTLGALLAVLSIAHGASAAVGRPAEDPRDTARAWRLTQGENLRRNWGIDIVGVRLLSSDWMLQFKYEVVDPNKARNFLARSAKPYLIDEASGAKLAVPAMENIGELRQTSNPQVGRSYFILFGNGNKIVKRGNRVNIEIGTFRADGLVVE